jgi:GTPase SAR1 family protein
MYDVTSRMIFGNIIKWIKSVRRVAGEIPIVLTGNKTDASGRKVKEKRGVHQCGFR